MANDGHHETNQVFIRLKKRILDDKIAEAMPVLHIFAVENFATTLDRSCDDERVVPRKLIAARQIQRTYEQRRRGMH